MPVRKMTSKVPAPCDSRIRLTDHGSKAKVVFVTNIRDSEFVQETLAGVLVSDCHTHSRIAARDVCSRSLMHDIQN
jgi:hypothetical protein